MILAAALRFSNLDALGYANHYYTAGVESMLKSWHNFFYVAAEPGGSVSIDKPPVGLWLQAISAYFLGVSGFSVLLPELLAGIISVILIYYLVRRSFGSVPGLIAGPGSGDHACRSCDRSQQHDRQHPDLDSASGGLGIYQSHRDR